jgi:hypothetical protein
MIMAREAGGRLSLAELEAAFERELATDRRAAAETAYALAFRYRDEDVEGRRRFDLAKVWATRAVELLEGLPSETVADVASTRMSVGGVPLPELLHAGVARERLADVLF